jgi:CelD/BcsL family acetyltransferase involved in cellulose biosynthesis
VNSVTLIRDRASFDALADEGWDDLVAKAPRPTPFLLHAWLRASWPEEGTAEPAVHLLRRGNVLAGALPLEATRVSPGLSVARFIGAPDAVFADVVMPDGESIEVASGLLESALAHHGLLDLYALSPEARIRSLVAPSARIRRTEAPVLELDAEWEAIYEAKTSARRRALHRRRWRQLAERGPVNIETAAAGTELERSLEDAFRLHAIRWDNRRDVTGFADARRDFHRRVVPELGVDGVVRLLTIKVGSRPAAFTLSFVLAGRLFLYRLAFDPDFAHASPGVLAVLETISRAAAEGVRVIEFLRGTERYKLDLADRVDPLEELVVGRRPVLAAAWRGLVFGRVRLRQAAVRQRALWRSRLRSTRGGGWAERSFGRGKTDGEAA